METSKKYRLLTRSDLDGLICAVLLKYLDMVKTVELIDSPGAMQAGEVEVKSDDIIANLPYVPGASLAFDHHVSETLRSRQNPGHVIDPDAPSAARVVYEYYGGKKRFPASFNELMAAVDKADSGQFSRNEILHPTGWALLNFLVDKRTGIEEWGKFAIDERQFKSNLIDWILQMPIDEVMALPDVQQRSTIYFAYQQRYKRQLADRAQIYGNIVVLDCRDQEQIYPGNRFVVYALYPQCNISIQIKLEKDKEKTTFSVGKSIINPTATVNIGKLMLEYGGGGHRAAGACHVDPEEADRVLAEILGRLGQKAPLVIN
ncbi:MAG: exopolyphosphatase [Thermodesulfobacteriota bacterium]